MEITDVQPPLRAVKCYLLPLVGLHANTVLTFSAKRFQLSLNILAVKPVMDKHPELRIFEPFQIGGTRVFSICFSIFFEI